MTPRLTSTYSQNILFDCLVECYARPANNDLTVDWSEDELD